MSNGFTIVLGIAEVAGALGVAFGVLTQLAAFGLIALMLGAIEKKIFSWHIGFWGEKTFGWHYDLMFVLMNLLIAHRRRTVCAAEVRKVVRQEMRRYRSIPSSNRFLSFVLA